jgi:hypothetical protein
MLMKYLKSDLSLEIRQEIQIVFWLILLEDIILAYYIVMFQHNVFVFIPICIFLAVGYLINVNGTIGLELQRKKKEESK